MKQKFEKCPKYSPFSFFNNFYIINLLKLVIIIEFFKLQNRFSQNFDVQEQIVVLCYFNVFHHLKLFTWWISPSKRNILWRQPSIIYIITLDAAFNRSKFINEVFSISPRQFMIGFRQTNWQEMVQKWVYSSQIANYFHRWSS